MDEVIRAVSDWPIIVQGIFAAALYSALVQVGLRLSSWVRTKYASFSLGKKETYLRTEVTRYEALVATGADRAFFVSALIFRAMRHIVLALIWMALGLIFATVLGPFSVVGYLGCIYYLLTAWQVVRPRPASANMTVEQHRQEIARINKELDEIEALKKK